MIAIIEINNDGRTVTIQSVFSKLVLVSKKYKRFHAIRDLADTIKEIPKIFFFAMKAVFVWRDYSIEEVIYNGEQMTFKQFLKDRRAQ